jgi:ABC-type multidrug transport system fused ATPase/permease subunit
MLELRHVSKRFSSIPAVNDVSLSARPGEVTGYLGPNGSRKSNIQLVFWAFFIVCLPLAVSLAEFEQEAFHHPLKFGFMVTALAAVACRLWAFNRHRAESAVHYFEELPEEVITTLGLSA